MDKTFKFTPGTVVLGAFPTKKGVIQHYSVVLRGTVDGAILVYTTSLKEPTSGPTVFSQEDKRLAGFVKESRWDASHIALVPNGELRAVGKVSAKTLTAITLAHARAQQQRTVSTLMLTTDNKIVQL